MPISHRCILTGIYITMVPNVVIMFGWTPMKIVEEIALRKVQLHMVLC